LLLATGFVAALLWCALPQLPDSRFGAFAAVCGVFVLDALYQMSFNQRELMFLFGVCAGVVLDNGSSARQSRPASRWVGLVWALAVSCLVVATAVPHLAASAARKSAEASAEEGDGAAALADLDRAEWWSPRDPAIPAARAPLVAPQYGAQSAVRELARAVALQPRSASLRAQLARWQAEAGDFAAAEESLRAATSLYPANPEYRHELARLLEQRGDLNAAVAEARLAVEHGYLYLDRYRAHLQSLETRLSAPEGGKR
jgi:hypothetical protein